MLFFFSENLDNDLQASRQILKEVYNLDNENDNLQKIYNMQSNLEVDKKTGLNLGTGKNTNKENIESLPQDYKHENIQDKNEKVESEDVIKPQYGIETLERTDEKFSIDKENKEINEKLQNNEKRPENKFQKSNENSKNPNNSINISNVNLQNSGKNFQDTTGNFKTPKTNFQESNENFQGSNIFLKKGDINSSFKEDTEDNLSNKQKQREEIFGIIKPSNFSFDQQNVRFKDKNNLKNKTNVAIENNSWPTFDFTSKSTNSKEYVLDNNEIGKYPWQLQSKSKAPYQHNNFVYHRVTGQPNLANFNKNPKAYIAVSVIAPKPLDSENIELENELRRLKPWNRNRKAFREPWEEDSGQNKENFAR